MSKLKKAAIVSPLLGAVILTIFSVIYIIIANFPQNLNEVSSLIMGLMNTIPIILILLIIFSYVLSLPIGFLLYREFERNLRTEKFFIKMSLAIGFIVSILFSLIDYQISHTLAKSFFIVIAITVMATANASYFMVLSEHIKIKENNNEKTKGNRV